MIPDRSRIDVHISLFFWLAGEAVHSTTEGRIVALSFSVHVGVLYAAELTLVQVRHCQNLLPLVVAWRVSPGDLCGQPKMVLYIFYHRRLVYQCDDCQPRATFCTHEHVDAKRAAHQFGPFDIPLIMRFSETFAL